MNGDRHPPPWIKSAPLPPLCPPPPRPDPLPLLVVGLYLTLAVTLLAIGFLR